MQSSSQIGHILSPLGEGKQIQEGNASFPPSNAAPARKRPCCICKPAKTMRDACIMNNGEEKCLDFVKAHRECLESNGFKFS